MQHIFFLVVYQPIYNALIFLYDIFGDFGIAIILLTILIKLALIPLSRKQIESQKEMQELQPKIKELQKKYKDDREKLSKETMALYKEHKVNPAAGCLPLIVQMIVFITVYQVIINLSKDHTLTVQAENLYTFIAAPENINHLFLGFMNLSEPFALIAVITAIAQYYQIKMMQTTTTTSPEKAEGKDEKQDTSEPDFATIMQKQMVIIIPVMTLLIGLKFPSGLTLYWLASTVFMIGQQWIITHRNEETIAQK